MQIPRVFTVSQVCLTCVSRVSHVCLTCGSRVAHVWLTCGSRVAPRTLGAQAEHPLLVCFLSTVSLGNWHAQAHAGALFTFVAPRVSYAEVCSQQPKRCLILCRFFFGKQTLRMVFARLACTSQWTRLVCTYCARGSGAEISFQHPWCCVN